MLMEKTRKDFILRAVLFFLLFCCFQIFISVPLNAAEAAVQIGAVKKIKPTAWAERGNRRIDLAAGSRIYEFDVIKTGDGATVTIEFIDKTVIELNPDSELSVLDVAHTPRSSRFSANIGKGWILVRSGGIGLKNPTGFIISTPKGVVSMENAVVYIGANNSEEVVLISEMTEGPVVSVYNAVTSRRVDVKSAKIGILTDTSNEMSEIRLEDYQKGGE
jgi:hypothetical protein